MIRIFLGSLIFCGLACGDRKPEQSAEVVTDPKMQAAYYNSLMTVVGNDSLVSRQDSTAFLILPLMASCPSCRTKAIKSIIKYQNNLPDNHFVILSAKATRKTMGSYFREEESVIPNVRQVLLDTMDIAGAQKLYQAKPTMYYAAGNKVYKKVAAVPATVVQDLDEYFKTDK